jgi:site-specific DNA-methyltransferase (cytosine-N4-specific)
MTSKHKIIIGDSRKMEEVEDETVHLMVTSPPYPMIDIWDDTFKYLDERIAKKWEKIEEVNETEKDAIIREIYELMHENLGKVWEEVYRVLVSGGIACINIGDATRSFNGVFRVFPNHSKVIEYCEKIGFVTLPYILWKKPTTKPKYKGVGAFLGSGMLPPNAYVTLDCEFILIFRKGKPRIFKPKDKLRYASRYTKEERNKWFTQIWDIIGTKQSHPKIERRISAFPEEVPYRLIRMFSIIGDTVLDPFLGTGTTTKVALYLNRNSIGYEIDRNLLPIIKEKVGITQKLLNSDYLVEIIDKDRKETF